MAAKKMHEGEVDVDVEQVRWLLVTQFPHWAALPLDVVHSSYGYVGGVLDLRVGSDVDTSTALWQLPRVRIGLGDTIGGLARWFRDQHL